MSDNAAERKLADRLFAEHQERKPFSRLQGALRPATMEAGYRVQDLLNERFAEAGRGPIAGYKIGLTSEKIRQMCNAHEPISGVIYQSRVHRSPAALKLADYMHLGLEFEMAVEIARDVPPDSGPLDAESVRDYIAVCMPAFELIDDRNADFGDLDALSIMADNSWCGGIVLGDAVSDWQGLDLKTNSVAMSLNGEFVESGVTGDAMGHPFESVAWVAGLLASQGRQLRAGMIIMTGSTLATRFPAAGEEYSYAVEGLGTVSATLS
jgi:2-keto-4-pentenoate hydratase